MRRRILEKIQLTKIAAVDRPAQEHALVTIMKRRPKKQQVDDPDDDNIEDDWSVNAPRKKKPKAWSRDDIDAVNKRKPPRAPTTSPCSRVITKAWCAMYLGLGAARREARKAIGTSSSRASRPRNLSQSRRPCLTLTSWRGTRPSTRGPQITASRVVKR